MKILLIFFFISSAFAGNLIPKNKKIADGILDDKWRQSVMHQQFPVLPPAAELKDDSDLPYKQRQRYIFQLDVNGMAFNKKFFEDNNWWIVYKLKGVGVYVLIVHPDFIECLENAKKKFDLMQWVVTQNGKYEGFKSLVLEQPRQCIGNYEKTGGKLKSPIQ